LTLLAAAVAVAVASASDLQRLGEKLFFDTRLSGDGTVSCASCHQPDRAFTDGLRVARGVGRREGTRNTPTLLDVGLQKTFFWDGRRATLEGQAGDPFVNPNEHGLANHDALVSRVRADDAYRGPFAAAFGARDSDIPVTLRRIETALAAYVRSLAAGETRFDRYAFLREAAALDRREIRGLQLFQGRANCSSCHLITQKSAPLTDGAFHATLLREDIAARLDQLTMLIARAGPEERAQLVSSRADVAELGRFAVTLDPTDIGKFRTPSLRNVAMTGPYFHDGSVTDLSDAVIREAYARGDAGTPRLILTPAEVADLVAFLQALTSASQLHAAKQLPVR